MIPLSRKADNFPHDGWSNLILLMTMAGGGGVGAVISLSLIARRNKQTYSISPDSNTNRLKKKAWFDFVCVCFFTVIALFMFGFLTYVNAKGVFYLIASLYPVCAMAVLVVIQKFRIRNNPQVPPFDEREFYLIQRSIHWGNNVFIVFALTALFVAFFIVGGKGLVPMWSVPLVFFCGLLLSGIAQFLVLMHYAKEDDKNIEGGAV